MSGKSTFLRQVALTVIMAQVCVWGGWGGVGGMLLAGCIGAMIGGGSARCWPDRLANPISDHLLPTGLAQVGAFVPAAFASLAPCDAVLARMGTGDSLETNSSSFMCECQVGVRFTRWAGLHWRDCSHGSTYLQPLPPATLHLFPARMSLRPLVLLSTGAGPHPLLCHSALTGASGRVGAGHIHLRFPACHHLACAPPDHACSPPPP